MLNTRMNQIQGVVISYEHLNKKYGFERQPRQAVVQVTPEDLLLEMGSDSDTENEIENLEATSPMLSDENEVNDQNLQNEFLATMIISKPQNDCSDTEEEDFAAVDDKHIPQIPSSASGEFGNIGSFQSMPSGISSNSIM